MEGDKVGVFRVPGLSHLLVTVYGDVFSIKSPGRKPKEDFQFLHVVGAKDKHGYTKVSNRTKNKFLHHLVLETFVGPCPEGMECRHLDRDPTNNHVDNLCWGTRLENAEDRENHGTVPKGEKHYKASLSEVDVLTIRERRKAGESLLSISEDYNITYQNVSEICNRHTWKHIKEK